MTTQTPMTPEEVFTGLNFRTNDGRQGDTFYFNGHLDAEQVAETYYAAYPEHRTRFPYAIETGSIRRAWHRFTLHEDDCYLIACADQDQPFQPDDFFDPTICSCSAAPSFDAGTGYEHRHPHPAAPGQPGAIAVTWAAIGPA